MKKVKKCHICNQLIDTKKQKPEEGHCFEDTCMAKITRPKCIHGFSYKHGWPMCDEYFDKLSTL